MKIKILDEYSYQTFPIVEDMIEVNEEQLNNIGNGYKFDLSTKTIVEDSTYQEQKNKQEKLDRISNLKSLLSNTDYKAIKYAEGQLTEEEYASIKAQRQEWRDEINLLESEV